MSLLLRALVVGALIALSAAQATPARSGGKGKGANVAPVCSASKNAWMSTSSCTKFQDGICATVPTCPAL